MEDKFGLLLRDRTPSDWMAGEFSPLGTSFLNPTGNWSIYLPDDEFQNRWGFDRQACVTYSILNCLEILHKAQTGVGINFSDRFLAKMSGTTKQGNYLDNVFDTIRKNGLVEEWEYPDDAKSWDEYYKEIPQALKDKGLDILKTWNFYREWVRTDRKKDILFALKSAPLQVTVKYASGNDLLNPVGTWNHAVTMFNAAENEYWEIFDHYTQTRKKYAWDYEFGSVLKPSLIKKSNINMNIQNNTFVQLVEAPGGFGLYLDGKLIIDDLAKIQATWIIRNNGDIKGKIKTLTLEQWNSLAKINLKGEAI